MAEAEATTTETKKKGSKGNAPGAKAKLGRRTLRKAGRDKRKAKLAGDKEFAKTFFDARSKRSTDKKSAFRKKKKGKK